MVLNSREAMLANTGNIHFLIKSITENGQGKTKHMVTTITNNMHQWEQKYIYLDNATDATPYCVCTKCGKDVDGWLESVSKNKEECKGGK